MKVTYRSMVNNVVFSAWQVNFDPSVALCHKVLLLHLGKLIGGQRAESSKKNKEALKQLALPIQNTTKQVRWRQRVGKLFSLFRAACVSLLCTGKTAADQ